MLVLSSEGTKTWFTLLYGECVPIKASGSHGTLRRRFSMSPSDSGVYVRRGGEDLLGEYVSARPQSRKLEDSAWSFAHSSCVLDSRRDLTEEKRSASLQ